MKHGVGLGRLVRTFFPRISPALGEFCMDIFLYPHGFGGGLEEFVLGLEEIEYAGGVGSGNAVVTVVF